MIQKYSFEDCYKILNSNTECSWNELRKAYRLLIQKWHPDRYKDNSKEKSAAETKIKELNKAYQQLSEYYRENDTLPRLERSSFKPQATADINTPHTEPQNTAPAESRKNTRKNKKPTRTIAFASILAIILSYSTYELSNENHPENSKAQNRKIQYIPKPSRPEKHAISDSKHDKNMDTNSKKNKPREKIRRQFTHGSSIGDVIMIQGPPTKVDGDIWYYGESKVYFRHGIVQRWERKLGSPLNAGISIKKSKKRNPEKNNTLIH